MNHTPHHNLNSSSNRSASKLSFLKWLPALLVVLGIGFLFWPNSESGSTANTNTPLNLTAVDNDSAADRDRFLKSGQKGSGRTRPIESLRVGDRVLAHNPQVSDEERASWKEPDWNQWLHLSLVMPKPDGSELKIEILRPESWVLEQWSPIIVERDGAETTDPTADSNSPSRKREGRRPSDREGIFSDSSAVAVAQESWNEQPELPFSPLRQVYRDIAFTSALCEASELDLVGMTVEMDLLEMGAVGPALITGVTRCPAIASGRGQPVTATFSHPPSTSVLSVLFEGESDPICVTDNHLFWSVDRQHFLPIGQMEVGARVQTYHGETERIAAKLPRPGPQVVYNLEVYGEHVYFVGEQGLLAPNMCSVRKGARPDGVDFEGTVWRYEYPTRLDDTWTASKWWNVESSHRYTRGGKNGIGGAYAGLTKATAKHEVDSYGALAGRVATRKTVRMTNLLDLRDPKVRKALGVSLKDLTRTNKSHGETMKYEITHKIGEWAKKNGYNGIIAPSAQFRGSNKRANLISFEDL
ncbi:MAG: RES domain-containing protein [Planctomycetota bacterium]